MAHLFDRYKDFDESSESSVDKNQELSRSLSMVSFDVSFDMLEDASVRSIGVEDWEMV